MKEDVEEVVPVGGSAHFTKVQKLPSKGISPDEAVAYWPRCSALNEEVQDAVTRTAAMMPMQRPGTVIATCFCDQYSTCVQHDDNDDTDVEDQL